MKCFVLRLCSGVQFLKGLLYKHQRKTARKLRTVSETPCFLMSPMLIHKTMHLVIIMVSVHFIQQSKGRELKNLSLCILMTSGEPLKNGRISTGIRSESVWLLFSAMYFGNHLKVFHFNILSGFSLVESRQGLQKFCHLQKEWVGLDQQTLWVPQQYFCWSTELL